MSQRVLPPPVRRLRIVMIGLSITSSWGNGHATTYRSLLWALCRRGHEVLFLERDMPWYAANRDQLDLPAGSVFLYQSAGELRDRWRKNLAAANLVIIGSFVPDGIAVIRLVKSIASGIVAFYDIDTPVTLASLAAGRCPYIDPELARLVDLYLSFTGGRVLQILERRYRVRAARALYCSVDPERHRPVAAEPVWGMGYSPSVRLFEAAACGTPIISDCWPGLETIFVPGEHILLARSGDEVLSYLREFPDPEREELARRARGHVLAHHTAAHRAVALEGYVEEALGASAPRRIAVAG